MASIDARSREERIRRALCSSQIVIGVALCVYLCLWSLTKTFGVASVLARTNEPRTFKACFDVDSPLPMVVGTSQIPGEGKSVISRRYHLWLFGPTISTPWCALQDDEYRCYLRRWETMSPIERSVTIGLWLQGNRSCFE